MKSLRGLGGRKGRIRSNLRAGSRGRIVGDVLVMAMLA